MNTKNKEFLEKLDKSINKRFLIYSQSIGPGIINKFKRLFFAPDLYIPHLLLKFGIIKIKPRKEIRQLFWGRKIFLQVDNDDAYFFCKIPPLSELNLIRFFIKNFKSNDVFYDIGANYGFYTYLGLEFCKEVHSFDPINYVIESIKENTIEEVSNKKLFLNNTALSNRMGKSNFYLYKKHIAGSSLVVDLKTKDKIVIEVFTITLDEYTRTHNLPTVIKIDVEGSEKLVIEGGINFFKNNAPIIAMEVWAKKHGGKISMEAVDLLRKLGYQSYYIDIEGEIHKIDGDLSEFVEKRNKGLDNFVFKK